MSEKMTCGHCGSIYAVTYSRVTMRDKDHADCDVCGFRLDSWDGSTIPHHELLQRGMLPPPKANSET